MGLLYVTAQEVSTSSAHQQDICHTEATRGFSTSNLMRLRHAFLEKTVSSFLLSLQMEHRDREKEREGGRGCVDDEVDETHETALSLAKFTTPK